MIWKGTKISMMRGVIPSDPQRSIFILPMVRIKIAVKRIILFDMKLAASSRIALTLIK
jgi:hypothetical protein